MQLDVDFVRSRFPAFQDPGLKHQAFFENAGGSYACAPVIERLTRFYRERKVQPYGPFAASRLAGEEMDEARMRLSAILNVPPEELSFGPSTSQNTYVLAHAFREWMLPGEAVVVTDQDHEANSGVWRRLSAYGVVVREWRMDPGTGHLDPAGLARLLDDKVRLVCMPHCSNVVAEINDVAAIARMVHDAGAVLCVDGVSFAPHGLPDVAATGADIYMFSSYKTYGPHLGIMTIRRSLAERLPSQGHYFNSGSLPKRFTPAGPDHAQIAAAAGIADHIDDLFHHHADAQVGLAERASHVAAMMRGHETLLLTRLLEFLGTRRSLRLLGPRDASVRMPTVAIVPKKDPHEIARELAAHGIMAAAGDFYAVRPLKALGIDPNRGVLRLSFVHYTSAEEVDRLIRALDHVL